MTHIKIYRVMPDETLIGDIVDGEPQSERVAHLLDTVGVDPADEDEVFQHFSGPSMVAVEAAPDAEVGE